MTCVSCLQGFKWECREHGNCGDAAGSDNSDRGINPNVSTVEADENAGQTDVLAELFESDSEDESYVVHGQDDSKLKDQQSTGRKRAAKMYPLAEGAPCEWQGKKNCGGGTKPIVGCVDGTQQARHHGPDKNTLNNEKGNVHRICHTCHNRWHTENDTGYVWGSTYPLHSPVAATSDDQTKNELYWLTRSVTKAKD